MSDEWSDLKIIFSNSSIAFEGKSNLKIGSKGQNGSFYEKYFNMLNEKWRV